MRYFEDLVIGGRLELGSYTFTQDDIIRFARQFDPQPFHVDPEAARASHFGGLVASGWHTAAIWMKLMIASRDQRAARGEKSAFGPSPGFRGLEWLVPVYVGDTLTYSTELIEKTELQSRPEWGLVASRNEAVNQNGVTAMRFIGQAMCLRRPPRAL
jgi:acyl dehydratase